MESKLKSFCIAKEIIDKMKRKPTEWEKILEIIWPRRGYYLKYANSSCNSTSEKWTTQVKNELKNRFE